MAAGDPAALGGVPAVNRAPAMPLPAAADGAAASAPIVARARGAWLAWWLPLDLLTTAVLAVVAWAAVALPAPGWVRFPFGVTLVLFLPGYALVSALFPSRDGPGGVDRVALGFALSLATIPPVALVLGRSRWGVALMPTVVALTGVALLGALSGAVRRARCDPGNRYAAALHRPAVSPPGSWSRRTQVAAAVFGLALVLLVAGGAPIVLAHLQGDRLTEFSLYNEDGSPTHFPRQLVAGQPVELRLGIANHEGRTVAYEPTVAGAGARLVDPPGRIVLADGEAWEGPVTVVATDVGKATPIVFSLWEEGLGAPYRTLRLIVDVAPSDG